jgi:glutaredoxin
MKGLLAALAVLVAVAVAVVGVGLLMPDAPVAGEAAAAVAATAKALAGDADAGRGAADLARQVLPKKTYYQYVDARGSVRFAEKLEDVPAAWRDRAGRVELEVAPPSTPAEARAARERQTGGQAAPAARAQSTSPEARPAGAVRVPSVIIYSAKWNEASQKALAWLDKQGIPYENRDVDAPVSNFRKLQERTGGRTVPAFEIDEEILRGFTPRRFKKVYQRHERG